MEDEEGGQIILPNNPFWPLSVRVEAGGSTPFNTQMLYAYQFRWPSFKEALPEVEASLSDCGQADGIP